jgi:alkylated DNA repair dioxygenase AlkB
VSFSQRYDFNEHKLFEAEPIPQFLVETYNKVQEASGFTLHALHQVLVTEYAPGAAIGWHKDRPVFSEVIGLSLLSACVLRFRRPLGRKWERFSIQAAPRSAYFLEGPARWQWEHSIPSVDKLRYSITFRDLRAVRE